MNIIKIMKSVMSRVFALAKRKNTEDDPPVELYKSLTSVTKSLAQQRRHKLFREAVAFSKAQLKDPIKRKFFSDRAKPGQRAFAVAMSMFLRFLGPKGKFTSGF